MRIGFLDREKDTGTEETGKRPEDAAFTFDSGAFLTVDDLCHHLMVFGTTGSGKSDSVALPLAFNLMRKGFGGLICDIKGGMGDDIRRIAASLGRAGEIVEYGSGPEARRVNLLAAATRDGTRRLLEGLATKNHNDSRSWAMKGAHNAADCIDLLNFLAPRFPDLAPSLALLAEMLDDFSGTSRLWEYFKKNVYNASNEEQARLVSSVENNKFHIFNFSRENGQSHSSSSKTSWEEQATWNLQGIRMGLRSFLEAPGVSEHFSASGAPGLEMCWDVMADRKILVRFDPETGPIGAELTRMIVSQVYRTILSTTRERRGPFFVLMDEFQELADLSGARYSDKNFVALARSFGGIFIGLTQSLASIRCDGNWTADAVESFVSNCNNVISFYSTDPATLEMAQRHDPGIFLGDMEPNHAFVVRYDKEKRRHVHGVETMNNEYGAMMRLMEGTGARQPCGCGIGAVSAQADAPGVREKKSFASMVNSIAPREEPAAETQRTWARPTPGKEEKKMADEKERKIEISEYGKGVTARFPAFFAKTVYEVSVPAGWRQAFEGVLRMCADMDLKCEVERVCYSDGALRVTDGGRGTSIGYLLNGLLKPVSDICMVCGSALPPRNETKQARDDDGGDEGWELPSDDHGCGTATRFNSLPVCAACLAMYMFGGRSEASRNSHNEADKISIGGKAQEAGCANPVF